MFVSYNMWPIIHSSAVYELLLINNAHDCLLQQLTLCIDAEDDRFSITYEKTCFTQLESISSCFKNKDCAN